MISVSTRTHLSNQRVKQSNPSQTQSRCLQLPRATSCSSLTVKHEGPPSGLLLEVDGAVFDLQQDGHRTAFNLAFKELGYDCVQWQPMVYNDLLATSDGTGEGLVATYFSTVGWPTMLATSDNARFVERVYASKQRHFQQLVATDGVPLRSGVQQVIGAALADGALVGMVAGTGSEWGAEVAASAQRLLGAALAAQVRVFTFTLAKGSSAEEDQDACSAPEPSLTDLLATAQVQVKQREAHAFVTALRGTRKSLDFAVDPSLLTAGSMHAVDAQYLSALTATMGVAAAGCLVAAASSSFVRAARAAGMRAVAIPRRCATSGSYPEALAKFEGYGVGQATWPRLKALLLQQSLA